MLACAALVGLAQPLPAQQTPDNAAHLFVDAIDDGALIPRTPQYSRCASVEETDALFRAWSHWQADFDRAVQTVLNYAAASAKVAADQAELDTANNSLADAYTELAFADKPGAKAPAQAKVDAAKTAVQTAKSTLQNDQQGVEKQQNYFYADLADLRKDAPTFAAAQKVVLAAKCPAPALQGMMPSPGPSPSSSTTAGGATVPEAGGTPSPPSPGGVVGGSVVKDSVVGPAVAPTPDPAKPNTKSGAGESSGDKGN